MTTVYFAGGEDTSYASLTTNVACGALSGGYRTAFARACIYAGAYFVDAWPSPEYAQTPSLGSLTSFWVHGRLSAMSTIVAGSGNAMLIAEDASGYPRIAVMWTGTSGQVQICTVNTAGTITPLVTSAGSALATTSSGAPMAVDLFINYGTSGQCTLYINGVAIADTGTGVNVTTNSVTSLNHVKYVCNAGGLGYGSGMNGGLNSTGWSEVIIQDTSTLGMAVLTLPPLATGNTQAWTGSVSNINEISINDSNYIYDANANDISEWTVSTSSMPAGTWNISAVVTEARVNVGSSGPQHFEWVVRTSDGSDHVAGSVAPTTSFSNYQYVWPTNPHTSAAWNAGELINSGVESLT